MATITLEVIAALGTTLGVASHLGYFIHGEHHMQSTWILAVFMLAPFILFIIVSRYTAGNSHLEAGKIAAVATGSYFTALSTSILVYRAFFHPLRNFPGPFTAKLSKLTHVLQIAKNSRNFIFAEEMFEKYGEFVRWVQLPLLLLDFTLMLRMNRIGPNEIITNSPEAVSAILSASSKCTKSPW
jgi:tryprostatin B 6-hydroxylase